MAADTFTTTRSLDEVRVVSTGHVDHPEGIAWFGGHVWCGTETGSLVRIDPVANETVTVAETGGVFLGVTFDGDGYCYAADISVGRILKIDPRDGTFETFCDQVQGRPLQSPNFMTFGPDGTMWVSESGEWFHTGDGFLLRIPPDGPAEIVDESARRWTNGLAMTADGRRLYVLETTWPGLSYYDVDVDGASVSERHDVLAMPEDHMPDGLALDSLGNVYIAFWRPDRIYRLSADHERLEVYLDDPSGTVLAGPTNIAFGGVDESQLFIANFSGTMVCAIDADVPGQPLHLPVFS